MLESLPTSLHAFLVHARGLNVFMGSYFTWLFPLRVVEFALMMVLYYFLPKAKFQNLVLVALGLHAAWIHSPGFMLLFLAGCLMEWLLAVGVSRSPDGPWRGRLVWISVAGNSALLAVIMLKGFHQTWLELLGSSEATRWMGGFASQFLKVGIKVALIASKTTLTLDAYRNRNRKPPEFLSSMAFMFLFTRVNGTLVDRSRDTIPQLERRRRWADVRLGAALWLLLQGVAELAMGYEIQSHGLALAAPGVGIGAAILGILELSLYLWLQFVGLVNVCRAFAAVAGIRLPENFDAPFLSTNIADFWRRWNTTLMGWLSEEVFARLAFRFRKLEEWGMALATIATFLVCGMLHRLDFRTLTWWVIQAGVLVSYMLARKRIRKFWKALGNPAWVPQVSTFATFLFCSYSMVTELFGGFGPVSMIARSRASVSWPETVDAFSTFRAVLFCSIGFGLQAAPRYLGGDTWDKPMPGWVRALAALALAAVAFSARLA